MIIADQIRAARALLQLDQTDLARRAHVSLATLRRSENGAARVSEQAISAIQRALESAGVEFIDNGVRRRRRRTPEEREALVREIMAIAHRSAMLAAENPGFTEDDLYDENGLPA
ncbi:MAG TPA: helix-turn-helix transcriptional regulator [Stellaceae bacterium]|jgi:transcriptional regulator with XRE-family HTH domain|nr:helix-turn-helix transcriptional regulator [Stellaceae bacterium]